MTGAAGAGAVMVGGPVIACTGAGALASAPSAPSSPPGAARTYDFNQGWLFGGAYTSGAEQPGHDDGRFARITVPHTVIPLSWADWAHPSWEKRWIYRKHFRGTDITGGAASGDRVLLTFDGVMTDATVVLNGSTLAIHHGGYLPWTTELTGHLRKDDNVLAVVVDGRWLDVPPDVLPGGAATIDYLQPAGIYRDVTLLVVPRIYLADVFARPVDVLTGNPAVKVTAAVDAGAVPAGRAVTVTAELLTGVGVKRAEAATTLTVTSRGAHTAALTIGDVGGVSYWSPEHPARYTVRTTVSYPGGTHTRTTTIGFRRAVFARSGFYLNDSRYEIFGLNRHQLYPYLGMAAPARLQRRDALILKQLNVNMVRCSHYPQSPHFLDACDELGIMVWQEPPGWGFIGGATFRRRFLDDVTNMVIRDRNRPSVVVWGTRLDETRNYPGLYAEARRLAYAHDGSRQTAGAVTFRTTPGWAEDVFSYDDYRVVNGAPELYPPVAGVPYLVSEAVGAAIDPHYRWIDPPATLARQANAHALVHDQARANPRYAGVLGWTGIDYYAVPNPASPTAIAGNWRTMRTPGVVDVFRVPKPGASIYQSQVSPATRPVIIPAFCWDDTAPPGARSMIATNCDRLELRAGGKPWLTITPDRAAFGSLGHPPAFADLTGARAAAGSAPGTGLPDLQIDGYVAGKLVTTLRMTADVRRDRLELTAADAEIVADGSDATAITIRATDAYGNRRPGVAGEVALALSGPGTLIGSNPFPLATLGGVGGGFVRSRRGETGQVTVTAAHATLGRASVRVTVGPVRSRSFR